VSLSLLSLSLFRCVCRIYNRTNIRITYSYSILTIDICESLYGINKVMWPRLVANKILRKSLGSNNFVADFPPNTDQKLIEASGLADERSKSILHNQHKTTLLNYKYVIHLPSLITFSLTKTSYLRLYC
jgi:hypothetical protein